MTSSLLHAVSQPARARLHALQNQLTGIAHRPWVAALAGLNPPRPAGALLNEMITLAGGQPALTVSNPLGDELTWDDIIQCQPEMIVVIKHGAGLEESAQEIRATAHRPEWDEFPATHLNQIYALNPVYYFTLDDSLAAGAEILAGLLHPHLCRHPLETEARRLTLDVRY